MKKYDEELKTKVIRLHLQEGRSQKSLEEEYNLGRGAIYYWLKSYSKECQTSPEKAAEKQDFDDYLRASLKTPFEKKQLCTASAASTSLIVRQHAFGRFPCSCCTYLIFP